MFYGTPQIVDQSGAGVELQSVEIDERHLLLRIRSRMAETEDGHGVPRPTAARERFELRDERGVESDWTYTQSASGPFQGIVDLAFARSREFDVESILCIQGGGVVIRFRLV